MGFLKSISRGGFLKAVCLCGIEKASKVTRQPNLSAFPIRVHFESPISVLSDVFFVGGGWNLKGGTVSYSHFLLWAPSSRILLLEFGATLRTAQPLQVVRNRRYSVYHMIFIHAHTFFLSLHFSMYVMEYKSQCAFFVSLEVCVRVSHTNL